MTKPGWKHRWSRIAAAGLLGVAMAASAGTGARAADDDDEDVAFDTKIFRSILQRARAAPRRRRHRLPRALAAGGAAGAAICRAPETGSIAEKTAAWPNDPDVKRAKEAQGRSARSRARPSTRNRRPTLPSQLGPRAATAPAGQRPTGEPVKDPTAPSTLAELGRQEHLQRSAA